MISNLVHESFDFLQYNLYGMELKSAGVGEVERARNALRAASGCSSSFDHNPNPFFSRVAAVPVAVVDIALETVRPLFLVVESVVFTTLSLFSALWNSIRLKSPLTAMRMTLINLHEAVYYSGVAVGRAAIAPLMLIAQLLKLWADPQEAQSSNHNFGSRKRSSEVKLNLNDSQNQTKDGIMKRSYHHMEERIYRKANKYATHDGCYWEKTNYGQSSHKVYSETLAKQNPHPIMSRVYAIPLVITDIVLEVVKPVMAAIASLALASLTLTGSVLLLVLAPLTLPIILTQSDKLARAFRYIFYQLDEAVTSLAEAAANVALSPITLISQLFVVWWDPKNARPSRVELYEPQDRTFSHGGDKRIRFGESIVRVRSTGVDELDWELNEKNQSFFLKQNYEFYVTNMGSRNQTRRELEEELTSAVVNSVVDAFAHSLFDSGRTGNSRGLNFNSNNWR